MGEKSNPKNSKRRYCWLTFWRNITVLGKWTNFVVGGHFFLSGTKVCGLMIDLTLLLLLFHCYFHFYFYFLYFYFYFYFYFHFFYILLSHFYWKWWNSVTTLLLLLFHCYFHFYFYFHFFIFYFLTFTGNDETLLRGHLLLSKKIVNCLKRLWIDDWFVDGLFQRIMTDFLQGDSLLLGTKVL